MAASFKNGLSVDSWVIGGISGSNFYCGGRIGGIDFCCGGRICGFPSGVAEELFVWPSAIADGEAIPHPT